MDIAVKSLDGSNAFIVIMQNILCFQIGNACFSLVEEAARRHVCICIYLDDLHINLCKSEYTSHIFPKYFSWDSAIEMKL